MEQIHVQRIMQLLGQIAAMQITTAGCIKEVNELLQAALLTPNNSQSENQITIKLPFIDSATLAVSWNGATCFLGATILLRLFTRLCRRPNFFICHENLLQDVWQGDRKSQSTVRSTVRRLKRSLEHAGMADLANSIRCEGGRYALVLEGLN
ncbi:MAG: winged helix-turn-helix domain-containing protein [Phycisphaerae bacterium]